MNLVLKEKKDVYGIGLEESEYDAKYHYELENYFKKEIELGIKERIITRKGTKFVYPHKNLEYRFLPEEFFSPTQTLIFSNYITIQSFQNNATIIIKSKSLADSYIKHFNHLWGIAEKRA